MNKQFYINFIIRAVDPKSVRVVSKVQALKVVEGLIKHETKLEIADQLELIATVRNYKNNITSLETGEKYESTD